MKLVAYSQAAETSWGVLVDGKIIDGRSLFGGKVRNIRELFAEGLVPELLHSIRRATATLPLDQIRIEKPIHPACKLICVGLNYGEHVAEAGREANLRHPSIFIRVAESVVAHDAPLIMPQVSREYDFEGELAVGIGKAGRKVERKDAADLIAGYTCFNDGSIRDYQRQSVTAGKNFYCTGAIGPWIVTADEFPDDPEFELKTTVSGVVMQHDTTRSMIFDIPELISYVSSIMPLDVGDIIATGTPAGVGLGRTPPRWLVAGDDVEVEISSIGVLRNRVVADSQ